MTLVVANRGSRGIRLVGDSKLTDKDAILRGGLSGTLKIIVLGPSLCVAFSGGVNRCLDAIRRLERRQRVKADQRLDVSDVEVLLSEAVAQGGGRDEFLVASLTPPALSRVRAEEVEHADQLWIGNHGAFEAHQRHFHTPTGTAQRAHAETPERRPSSRRSPGETSSRPPAPCSRRTSNRTWLSRPACRRPWKM